MIQSIAIKNMEKNKTILNIPVKKWEIFKSFDFLDGIFILLGNEGTLLTSFRIFIVGFDEFWVAAIPNEQFIFACWKLSSNGDQRICKSDLVPELDWGRQTIPSPCCAYYLLSDFEVK